MIQNVKDIIPFTIHENIKERFYIIAEKELNRLFNNSEKYLDSNFLSEISKKESFNSRYWELYFFNVLIKYDFPISVKNSNEGPDIYKRRTKRIILIYQIKISLMSSSLKS